MDLHFVKKKDKCLNEQSQTEGWKLFNKSQLLARL